MKKLIINICISITCITSLALFIFWLRELILVQSTVDFILHPYFELYLSYSLIEFMCAMCCIITLVLINKGEGEILKMSMKEGLAKWRKELAEKKTQKSDSKKQARISKLERELEELKKDG